MIYVLVFIKYFLSNLSVCVDMYHLCFIEYEITLLLLLYILSVKIDYP